MNGAHYHRLGMQQLVPKNSYSLHFSTKTENICRVME